MIVKPPTSLSQVDWRQLSVFLAGSIEMGAAEDWQSKVSVALSGISSVLTGKVHVEGKIPGCTVLNPRRDDWDSSWEQKYTDPKFREQVQWEMEALERCDFIFMNFCAETKSPISLLELGLHARSKKIIVCCPDDFWRQGNVETVCVRHCIPLFKELPEAIECLVKLMNT